MANVNLAGLSFRSHGYATYGNEVVGFSERDPPWLNALANGISERSCEMLSD
jgi:hypothetical protein